ncbi:MAG: tetratricopeptide repeat protein [Anaerolineaceae bacterium]|nr:tetratricopeptide repeat protein [Anaerolineaceae bacterium]
MAVVDMMIGGTFHKTARHIFAVLLLLLVTSVTAQDGGEGVILTIANPSPVTICSVRIMPASAPALTDDMLHSEAIAPGTEHIYTIPPGMYHIGLWDCGGNLLFSWYALTVSQAMTLTYADPASVLTERGSTLLDNGQYAEALDIFQQLLAIYQQTGNRPGEANTLSRIGYIRWMLGLNSESLDAYAQALAIYQQEGIDEAQAGTLLNMGLVYEFQGDLEQALATNQQALIIAQENGYRSTESGALNNIGDVYRDWEQPDTALDYYMQALAIRQATNDQTGLVTTLLNLGRIHHALKQDDQSLADYHQLLTIQQEIEDRKGQAATLLEMGSIYSENAAYDEALDFYNQALIIQQEIEDFASAGMNLTNIGLLYSFQGQYDQSLAAFNEGLVIQRRIGNHSGESLILTHLGTVYMISGRESLALDTLNQAFEVAREYGSQTDVALVLARLGQIYTGQGQYTEALDAFNQAWNLQKETNVPIDAANTLTSIGLLYQRQGKSGQALDYYDQALAIQRASSDQMGEANTLDLIGQLYQSQGRTTLALDYLSQALELAQQLGIHRVQGQTLADIAGIYRVQGETSQALAFYEEALAIMDERDNQGGKGWTLTWMAGIYSDQGQRDLAKDTFDQALAIHRQVGDPAGESTVLVAFAMMAWEDGDYDQALALFDQAIMIRETVNDEANLMLARVLRGMLYEATGQRDRAIAAYEMVTETSEQVVSGGALDTAITNLSQQFQNRMAYQRLAVLLAQNDDPVLALDYAERGRAILTRNQLQSGGIDFRANADQSLLQREQELRLRLQEAQDVVDSLKQDLSATRDSIQAAEQALDDARRDYDLHLDTMQLQGGFLERELSFQTATLERIQAAIPDDTTLLVYVISASLDFGRHNEIRKSVVFLITAHGLDAVFLDVTAEEIAEWNDTFAADRLNNTLVLRNLYDRLITPIADHLTTSHLIISPDGPLNYVPFAALQAPDEHYLINDYSISMVPSATALVLLSQRKEPASSSPALVLAQSNAPGLPLLTHANLEALDIADLFSITPILNASETELRQAVPGSRVLHISAHAELDPFAPLYSVIYLREDDDNDGRLEVREVYGLDLAEGTELVVLSGCETGSGGDGEDFGLLNRAFFAAGAEKVVSSLWQVDDAATATLLVAYMRARATHLNDAEALRDAMLETRERYPQVYYWASFALNGLPESVNNGS